MPSSVEHKVVKSDKVATIAKKHGHRDWKLIWKDPANKKLVKLRGKPEHLTPGDIIVVPPTKAEVEAAAAYATELQEAMIVEMKHAEFCDEFATQFERMAKSNRKSLKTAKVEWEKVIASTKYTIGYAEGTAKDVETAAEILSLFAMGVGVANAGAKAATADAKTLTKANDDFSASIVSAAASPLQKHVIAEGTKFLKDGKRNGSKGALLVGEVLDAFALMQRPSYWGKNVAKVIGNRGFSGVGVDTAIKDLKATLKTQQKSRDTTLANYLASAEHLEARVKDLRSASKRAKSNFKALEKQLNALL